MNYCFSQINLPERASKPRSKGISMILDKGLGLRELNDLLETAGSFIDIVKLGWGTSLTQGIELVKQKCELLARHQVLVCPGGTLTELAYFQNKLDWYLDEARNLGFSCIEVSNGTIPILQDEKLKIIHQAIQAGFRVTSEVGSKISEEDQKITMEERISQIQSELDAGVWKVILEARESGTQGIFNKSGVTQLDLLNQITSQINADDLIFEAPQRNQQSDLILSIGNNVNLGNIAPSDVIPLETLRLGLRS
ncbi:MAG: phosphosulfolactate synthase, partial [Cyanobacteriota bacterium]